MIWLLRKGVADLNEAGVGGSNNKLLLTIGYFDADSSLCEILSLK